MERVKGGPDNRSISDKKFSRYDLDRGNLMRGIDCAHSRIAKILLPLVFVKMSIFQQFLFARLSDIWNPSSPNRYFHENKVKEAFSRSGVRAINSSHKITPI